MVLHHSVCRELDNKSHTVDLTVNSCTSRKSVDPLSVLVHLLACLGSSQPLRLPVCNPRFWGTADAEMKVLSAETPEPANRGSLRRVMPGVSSASLSVWLCDRDLFIYFFVVLPVWLTEL